MILNYCTECGAPLQKETTTKYTCTNGRPYWNNARTTATILLIKGDQALFSKRAINPKKDKYDFPGGFVEYGKSAYQAVKRELQEETSLTTDDLMLLHSTAQTCVENVSVCDFIFVPRHWEGEPQAADDVASLEWKPLTFIDTPEFAWDYTGLVAKLQKFLEN